MNSGLKHVRRFEYGRSKGWFVRIEQWDCPIRKLFSDTVYGGSTKAFAMAKRFAKEQLANLPKTRKPAHPPGPGRVKRQLRSYVNAAGEVVYYDAWVAWIKVAPYTLASTNASAAKHGSRKAKQMVMAWLAKKRREQARNYRATK